LETFFAINVSPVFDKIYDLMEIKNRILFKKVSDLYNRYGIRSVSMDDVARELGISKKTIYQYVKDKEALVEKVIMYELSEKRNFTEDDRSRNAIEDLFYLNSMIIKIIRETNPSKEYDLQKYHPTIYEKISELRRERTISHMKHNFRKGKEEGLYRTDLDEDILAKMYVMRMGKITHDDEISISEFTSEAFINEVFIYHIRGIASKKGIEFLENNIDKILKSND